MKREPTLINRADRPMYFPSVLLVEICFRAKHCACGEILLSKSIENSPGRVYLCAEKYLIGLKEIAMNTGAVTLLNSKGAENLQAA